jgi:MraZ protein
LIVGSASTLEFDKQGRINLPSNLLNHAGASKECVVVGVLDHVEIWSKDVWDSYQSAAMEDMEVIAEKLLQTGN